MTFQERYTYNLQTDLLGKGGFARVYKAHDTLLARDVAVKVFVNTGANKYNVIEEIKKVIQFSHPNLLAYYDVALIKNTNAFGESEDMEVGIMELADFGDLKTFAKNNPNSPVLFDLLQQILSGLTYLHNKGIIHRDLKPQNILLKQENGKITAKISDFGISKDTESLSHSDSMPIGTIEYMAPEQFSPNKYGINGKISTNLDLWSFGVLVHELLTDTTPFGKRSGDTTAEQVMASILASDLPEGINDLPEPYKSIIKKCLVQDAKVRIKHASDLIKLMNQKDDLETEFINNIPQENQGKVKEENIEPLITNEIYDKFIDSGIVPPIYLNAIVEKYLKNVQLTKREQSIFISKTIDIEKIIKENGDKNDFLTEANLHFSNKEYFDAKLYYNLVLKIDANNKEAKDRRAICLRILDEEKESHKFKNYEKDNTPTEIFEKKINNEQTEQHDFNYKEKYTSEHLIDSQTFQIFIDTGKVDESYLELIAEKIISNEGLSKREQAIYNSFNTDIKEIIARMDDSERPFHYLIEARKEFIKKSYFYSKILYERVLEENPDNEEANDRILYCENQLDTEYNTAPKKGTLEVVNKLKLGQTLNKDEEFTYKYYEKSIDKEIAEFNKNSQNELDEEPSFYKRHKSLILFLSFGVLLSIFSTLLELFSNNMPEPTGLVSDFEEIIDDDQEKKYLNLFEKIKKDHGVNMQIVTIENLYDKDDFSALGDEIYNKWTISDSLTPSIICLYSKNLGAIRFCAKKGTINKNNIEFNKTTTLVGDSIQSKLNDPRMIDFFNYTSSYITQEYLLNKTWYNNEWEMQLKNDVQMQLKNKLSNNTYLGSWSYVYDDEKGVYQLHIIYENKEMESIYFDIIKVDNQSLELKLDGKTYTYKTNSPPKI